MVAMSSTMSSALASAQARSKSDTGGALVSVVSTVGGAVVVDVLLTVGVALFRDWLTVAADDEASVVAVVAGVGVDVAVAEAVTVVVTVVITCSGGGSALPAHPVTRRSPTATPALP